MNVITLVVENASGTDTYEFYDLEEAIKAYRHEQDLNIDSNIYLIDYMGNIININSLHLE